MSTKKREGLNDRLVIFKFYDFCYSLRPLSPFVIYSLISFGKGQQIILTSIYIYIYMNIYLLQSQCGKTFLLHRYHFLGLRLNKLYSLKSLFCILAFLLPLALFIFGSETLFDAGNTAFINSHTADFFPYEKIPLVVF